MIYVMSDIHGNMRRFRSVMEQIDLQPEDTLYVLGDVIDRYPFGIDILEEIMAAPNIKMLLGNHEYMMLNSLYPLKDGLPWYRVQNWSTLTQWYHNAGEITEDALAERSKERRMEIFDYLKALPLNIDVEVNGNTYKLVHAAPVEFFTSDETWYYDDETAYAVWKRDFDFSLLSGDYVMVFGHTPTLMFQDNKILSIWTSEDGNAIGIDCGSGLDEDISPKCPVQGRLACLRLDDMRKFYSKEKTEFVMDLSESEIQSDYENA